MNVKSPEYVARSVATPRAALNALALRDTSWILTAENAVPVVSTHFFLSSWLFTSSFWNERESVCKTSNTIVVKRTQIKISSVPRNDFVLKIPRKLCARKI